ncbi:unnamed protein product, partial [Ixodes pacificus]
MDKLAHRNFGRVISRNLLRRSDQKNHRQNRGLGACFLNPGQVTAPVNSSSSTYSTDAGTDAALLEKFCVDFAEVRDLLKKGTAFFVDVREPNELINDGRINGAVNIP